MYRLLAGYHCRHVEQNPFGEGTWGENVEHTSEFPQLRAAASKGIDSLALSTGQSSKVEKKGEKKNSPQEESQLFAGSPAPMQG